MMNTDKCDKCKMPKNGIGIDRCFCASTTTKANCREFITGGPYYHSPNYYIDETSRCYEENPEMREIYIPEGYRLVFSDELIKMGDLWPDWGTSEMSLRNLGRWGNEAHHRVGKLWDSTEPVIRKIE